MVETPTEVTSPEDAKSMSLIGFGNSAWFTDPAGSSIWLQMFAVIGIPLDGVRDRFRDLCTEFDLGRPVRFTLAHVSDFKFPTFDYSFFGNNVGQLVVQVNGRDCALPNALYATLATPYRGDGMIDNEGRARARLARAGALLVTHCGFNLLRYVVFDGEVETATGKYSIPGNAIRTPQLADGPFSYPDAGLELVSIALKVQSAHIEVRQRIELALEFFARSVRQDDQFFNMWTALEILCNGSSQRIRAQIQGCYHLRSIKDVDEQLGFKQIARWRHDYFHKGIRPNVSSDVERYIQLLFLDLLRSELGMPMKGYGRGFTQSAGFDLSSIGLCDRRTPDQIAAIERSRATLTAE